MFILRVNVMKQGRAEANGRAGGAERPPPPADHLSENFALLSEFLCSK